MGEKKTVHIGIVILIIAFTLIMNALDLLNYLFDHTALIPTIIIVTVYFVLVGSQFYYYLVVRKFETLDQLYTATHLIAIFDLICIVVLVFMERDFTTLLFFGMSLLFLWIYIDGKIRLRKEGGTLTQDSDILSN